MAFKSPLTDGLVEDWDAAEALLEYALSERLRLGTSSSSSAAAASSSSDGGGDFTLGEHPVILAEHMYASKADRERWAQILFEKYRVPGFFVSKAGVLALYANARTTGLVVDMGAGGTQIMPVQEGYPLMMGARLHGVGGKALDGLTRDAVESSNAVSLPAAITRALKGRQLHASLLSFQAEELARGIKESLCRVREQAAVPEDADGSEAMQLGEATYELPDGTTVTVGKARYDVPEALFQPSMGNFADSTLRSAQGLPEMIIASAMACDPEARRDLIGNLVLTGGASRLTGLQERISRDVAPIVPVGTRARWAFSSSEERSFGAWTGGSILGSLGTFHDMWLSADEYKEHGAKLIHRKCP